MVRYNLTHVSKKSICGSHLWSQLAWIRFAIANCNLEGDVVSALFESLLIPSNIKWNYLLGGGAFVLESCQLPGVWIWPIRNCRPQLFCAMCLHFNVWPDARLFVTSHTISFFFFFFGVSLVGSPTKLCGKMVYFCPKRTCLDQIGSKPVFPLEIPDAVWFSAFLGGKLSFSEAKK